MTDLVFLCSNSETNEYQCAGSNGAKYVALDVPASENKFQTSQHEPRCNHEECAKGIKRATSGAVRTRREQISRMT